MKKLNISTRSLYLFFTTNFFLIFLGFIEHTILTNYNNIFIIYIFLLIRNFILLFTIDYNTRNKPQINIYYNNNEFYLKDILINNCIDTITTYYYSMTLVNQSYIFNPLYFILTSFKYELILDFFHYIIHRLLHYYSFLYKNIHKIHHERPDINIYSSFRMNFMDTILTVSVPVFISVNICNLTLFDYSLLQIYQKYIEIAGHSDKLNKTASFLQCNYIPKILNIELYNTDHNKHHTLNNCNYSKRFSLYDKIFNTFK